MSKKTIYVITTPDIGTYKDVLRKLFLNGFVYGSERIKTFDAVLRIYTRHNYICIGLENDCKMELKGRYVMPMFFDVERIDITIDNFIKKVLPTY